jgi:ANTAR domain
MLMARHGVNADRTFELLRDRSQHSGRKVEEVAGT